jgi:hypothetical protein
MFISSRLMAAVRVADTGAVLHIAPVGRDTDCHVIWRCVVEDSTGHVLDDTTGLRSPVDEDPDPTVAMRNLLGFLGAAADAYRHTLNGQHTDNTDLFPPDVCEWAYEHDDEIAALALELTDPPDAQHTHDAPGAMSLHVPYLDLTDRHPVTILLFTVEQKWALVDQLLDRHGYQRSDVPEAWADDPLNAWGWLILATNDIDHDPLHPLTDWRIGLSATTALRTWIWAIA